MHSDAPATDTWTLTANLRTASNRHCASDKTKSSSGQSGPDSAPVWKTQPSSGWCRLVWWSEAGGRGGTGSPPPWPSHIRPLQCRSRTCRSRNCSAAMGTAPPQTPLSFRHPRTVPVCLRCGMRAANCCRFESHSGRNDWSGDGRPRGSNGTLQQSGWSCRSRVGRPIGERKDPAAPETRLTPRGKRHIWWTGWPLGRWRRWHLPGLWIALRWSTQRQNRWLDHLANVAPPVRTHQSSAADYPGNSILQDSSWNTAADGLKTGWKTAGYQAWHQYRGMYGEKIVIISLSFTFQESRVMSL